MNTGDKMKTEITLISSFSTEKKIEVRIQSTNGSTFIKFKEFGGQTAAFLELNEAECKNIIKAIKLALTHRKSLK